jgi:hypothetical protein
MDPQGRPARELSDEELERQGTHAHATRNWVFLHGTAEQFARHTERMLELEQEYLRRHPKRTWQGAGATADAEVDEATMLRSALRGIVRQVEALLEDVPHPAAPPVASEDPSAALLARVAAAPWGRLHKLEAHQAAREVGLDRVSLARLYTAEPPLLAAEQDSRVITPEGREWLAARQA